MKTRVLPLSLALIALLTLFVGAFSDVPLDTWYAGSVAICKEAGLLKGTGSETFSPDAGVSMAELMTVAGRLHHRQATGESALPAAPDSWGKGAIQTPAGSLLLSFPSDTLDRGMEYHYDAASPRQLHLHLNVTPQELAALTPAGGGAAAAALSLNGIQVLSGSLAPAAEGRQQMVFTAIADGENATFHQELSTFLAAPTQGLWYRDGLWYAVRNGFLGDDLMEQVSFDAPATRQDLAAWLSAALTPAQLPAINAIDRLPDTDEPAVLALYRAGILCGMDSLGTFRGELVLTRAELATILSRIERPEFRIVQEYPVFSSLFQLLAN